MATAAQVATLRLYVAEPDETTWTDEQLESIIDGTASLNLAAVEVWDSKAAGAASLVDISEGGSSRKNSDLFKNAQLMRSLFFEREQTASASAGTRIKRLSR